MLLELRAENYAVIDHAIAGFGSGLNLLTGETGAGKSILVDALALLMGQKASTDVIRHGADRAILSCVFESTPGAELILEANGLDTEGAEIILRREILENGKGRVFVNNQAATVAVLRALAPELALIHAQSETLSGFDPAQQRILLDRFAGASTQSALDAAEAAYARWREIQERLADLERDEQDRLRLADLWSFQAREIQSAESPLMAAQKHVEELARYDARFLDAVQQLASARATIEDVANTVRDYAEGIDASPERLAEIEDRLALLDRLKRKYGPSLAAVIAFGEEAARKLAEIENRDEILKSLRADLAKAAAAYKTAARTLTNERTAAAKKLEKLAESQINDLAMKARFAI